MKIHPRPMIRHGHAPVYCNAEVALHVAHTQPVHLVFHIANQTQRVVMSPDEATLLALHLNIAAAGKDPVARNFALMHFDPTTDRDATVMSTHRTEQSAVMERDGFDGTLEAPRLYIAHRRFDGEWETREEAADRRANAAAQALGS